LKVKRQVNTLEILTAEFQSFKKRLHLDAFKLSNTSDVSTCCPNLYIPKQKLQKLKSYCMHDSWIRI